MASSDSEIVIKKGSDGTKVQIKSNFIRLKTINEEAFQYQFKVQFMPYYESPNDKKEIVEGLRKELGPNVFLNSKALYLPKLFENNVEIFNTEFANKQVKVKITFLKKLNIQESLPIFDELFKEVVGKLGFEFVHRNFFKTGEIHEIPHHRLEIWPGFVTNVFDREDGLILFVDVSQRTLSTQTLWEILDICRKTPIGYQACFTNVAVGQLILARYNNKIYKIDDVDWNTSPLSFFKFKGKEITFKDYYLKQYNIEINDWNQPMLIHRPRNPKKNKTSFICLVPELCHFAGLKKGRNDEQGKEIRNAIKSSPQEKVFKLESFLKKIQENEEAQKIFIDWGYEIDTKFIELDGRVISGPSLTFNKQKIVDEAKSDFTNTVTSNPVYNLIETKNYQIYCTKFDERLAKEMAKVYSVMAQKTGLKIPQLIEYCIVPGSGKIRDFQRTLRKLFKPDLIDFIIIILPGDCRRADLYNSIKKWCHLNQSISNQVIFSKSITNFVKLRTVMHHVALQINCKLGGASWSFSNNLEEPTMIVGIDVYHDPRRRAPSAVAIIGSMNNENTKFISLATLQRNGQEIIDGLYISFDRLLKDYRNQNDQFPSRIILYRDGMGGKQLLDINSYELEQIERCFKDNYENEKEPKFTCIIVQKRIAERFFVKNENGEYINPNIGTVIDHTVTRKYLYDFFIVSQLRKHSTVVPTHYVVLKDNSNLCPDAAQNLTYGLSYMYFNHSGVIRFPHVCQYAHKLANFVGNHLGAVPDPGNEDKLYYL